MRSGTRLVVLFVLVAAGALVLFRLYGARVVEEGAVQTPLAAARDLVQADNTVVGRLGAIRDVAAVRTRALAPGDSGVALVAEVIGARGSGTLYADVEPEGRRWRVVRARFVGPGGEILPLVGDSAPALAPRPR